MGLSKNNVAIANFFDWFALVAAILGLLGLASALIWFCINIANESHKRDRGSLCSEKDAMGDFATSRSGGLCQCFPFECWKWPTAGIPRVPTLAELFQAGDAPVTSLYLGDSRRYSTKPRQSMLDTFLFCYIEHSCSQ